MPLLWVAGLAVVMLAVAFGAGVIDDRVKARRVLKARLAELDDPNVRLQPGFDDRPECPRGHGHMERFGSSGWWCSKCCMEPGHGGAYRKQCRCGAWIPEDWTGCVVCGRKRPRAWL